MLCKRTSVCCLGELGGSHLDEEADSFLYSTIVLLVCYCIYDTEDVLLSVSYSLFPPYYRGNL